MEHTRHADSGSDPVETLRKCTEHIHALYSLLQQQQFPTAHSVPIAALVSTASDILSSHQLALAACRTLLATVADIRLENAQLRAKLTAARFDQTQTSELSQARKPPSANRRPLKRARVLDSESESDDGQNEEREIGIMRETELVAPLPLPLPQARPGSRPPKRPHAIPSSFRSLTTFARRRYMDGKFAISTPNTLVLAHSLATPRRFDAADAQLFTGKLCDEFRSHGELVQSIASLLIHAGSIMSFSLADVLASAPKVKTHMQFEETVFAYLMRWTLRPLVVVRVLAKGENSDIVDQLVDAVAENERYMIQAAQLVVMVGIECDGYDDGLFEDSVFPAKESARFRVRERYGLVAGDLTDQRHAIAGDNEEEGELAHGYDWDQKVGGPNAVGLPPPTRKLISTLPPFDNVEPPNFDIHLDIPAELIKSVRSRNPTCRLRYEHGHLLSNQSSLRILSHLLVPARVLDQPALNNYLAILNANASFKRKMSPAIVQALLPYGLGTPVSHETLRGKLAATDANYTFVYTWRSMLYSFVRPVLVLETATKGERPDLWAVLRARIEPGVDVPKDAHLALLLGVECVGMEEPTREAQVQPVGERWYTLRERVGIVAKAKRQVGKRRRTAAIAEEEEQRERRRADAGDQQRDQEDDEEEDEDEDPVDID
ncbi:hypothetical protein BCR44DRAFT_1446941 [Catenaria anguillulae PL171]|uniref:Uncharacterized protein n=1 Tax=Catenaria anguillulae PL171 TaxID=765915 RepID=A0A1Y2H604_9FUNG|nr:hypothetical protein BCR44DRAFT_1446941 [Catenaria anguillulae PL171]